MDSGPFESAGLEEDLCEFQSTTSLHKSLILESNCHSPLQYSVQVPYNYMRRELDLGRTLFEIFQTIIPKGHTYQVFYYCSSSEYYLFGGMYPFQNYLLLDSSFVDEPVISVKIIRIHPPAEEEAEMVTKKKRVNDRNIKEVLEKVAEWRSIHSNKGITLEEAAKEIDLPKKTLDDYFYQIKQGESYNFDFDSNLNEKIGILRKFVKENHTKKEEKPSKIIEQFMSNYSKDNEYSEESEEE